MKCFPLLDSTKHLRGYRFLNGQCGMLCALAVSHQCEAAVRAVTATLQNLSQRIAMTVDGSFPVCVLIKRTELR
jgi:hypothetical protein